MYYSLENKTDREVGNVYPQVSCINLKFAHSIEFDTFSNFDSEILFELNPKAKLTDILSQSAISASGFLMNEKTKKIFSSFTIMKHRFYKCLVKDTKGQIHNYYWLHISDYSVLNKIDYKLSKFYKLDYGFREGDIFLNSYEDYEMQKKELGKMSGIGSDYIKLNKEFDFSLDLFSIPIFGKTLYASKRLISIIKSTQITGVLIKETNMVSDEK